MTKSIISNNIKFFRKQKGWTQKQLADKLNITRSQLGNYESKQSNLSVPMALSLSEIFNISIHTLVNIKINDVNFKDFTNLDNNRLDILNDPNIEYQPQNKQQNNTKQGAFGAKVPIFNTDIKNIDIVNAQPTGIIETDIFKVDAFITIQGEGFPPKIQRGDLIGIKLINPTYILDTSKIYLILTAQQTMLKKIGHIEADPLHYLLETPNTSSFKFPKQEIKKIYEVVAFIRSV